MHIQEGDKVRLVDRLQNATLRIWNDHGSGVAVLFYEENGRTDGLPVYMQKEAVQPIDEPTDRDKASWGNHLRQYYRDDEVRLITPFAGWIMVVTDRSKPLHGPGYVLVRFGQDHPKAGFIGQSMAWWIHVCHLERIGPIIRTS